MDWKASWKEEERSGRIHGWDFSHLEGRYAEEGGLPWDYKALCLSLLEGDRELLDMDTGGGEFLLSLGHPHARTAATENYPPNVALCRERLSPLGVDFRDADARGALPFADGRFDVILNRHGSYNIPQLWRCLRPGGVFLTEQVGADNDRELVELLLPGAEKPFPENTLERQQAGFEAQGFRILQAQEARRPIRFLDVGALVWFAKVIAWEFPGFSVEGCLDRLMEAQRQIEERGVLTGTAHRFLLLAEKPISP